MFTITIDSNDHDYNIISYYIIKLTNYKKIRLDDHDYILPNKIKLTFKFEKKKINVKTYQSNEIAGTEHGVSYLNFLEISSTKLETLDDFIKKAHIVYDKDHFYEANTISIWTPHGYSPMLRWKHYANLQIRDIKSVILDKGIKEDLIDDVTFFKKNKKLYNKYGIPYKRVYCLYGPPGTGKSSIIFSIASKLKNNIAMLNFGSGVTDSAFISLMSGLRPNSILLLEDIDSLFEKRVASSSTSDGFLSFSTLLNVLDGNLRKTGLLTFMTTNHPEKLDKALLRKGRIDYMIKIGYITKYQLENFAKLYYPKITKKQLAEYCKYLSSHKKQVPSVVSSFMFSHRDLKINKLLELIKKNKSLK